MSFVAVLPVLNLPSDFRACQRVLQMDKATVRDGQSATQGREVYASVQL